MEGCTPLAEEAQREELHDHGRHRERSGIPCGTHTKTELKLKVRLGPGDFLQVMVREARSGQIRWNRVTSLAKYPDIRGRDVTNDRLLACFLGN